ncbi:ABC transporter permease [Thermogemmatispora sp.]|jgi:peptide/nickel transport system permease protein|uniref:ABC transporter permease n=1 Tax=Thermogemmatispora sp. TaxID=1968838 RepID=UPI00257C3277|nr:ABC transporter permease [Thermogemmatispora sp.]
MAMRPQSPESAATSASELQLGASTSAALDLVSAGAGKASPGPASAPVSERPWMSLWRIFTLNRKAMVGMCIVGFFFLVAIFGPFFIHTDPSALSNDVLVPPSPSHWLGTTQTGQDIFSQLVVGTRVSILWGLATGLVVTAISVLVGLCAGYLGGIVDEVLSLLINVFLVLPSFPLAVLLAAYVPFKGPLTVAVVITLTSWAYQARVLRAQTLSLRRRDFVEAARSSGESTWRIIFFEIFPNEIAIVAAGFVGTAIYVILAAAGLEFLGLGDVTVVDWGTMFYWAQNNDALLLGAWWWFAAPGLCIALLGAGLALINFGIDEVANPRLRSEARPSKRLLRQMLTRSVGTGTAPSGASHSLG